MHILFSSVQRMALNTVRFEPNWPPSIEKNTEHFCKRTEENWKLEEDDIVCFIYSQLRAEIPITLDSPVPIIQSAQETWNYK